MSFLQIQTRFGELVGDSDWLNNPEVYLGPNYQAVIDWWTFLGHKKEVDPKGFNLQSIHICINTNYKAYHTASNIIRLENVFYQNHMPHAKWNGLMNFRDCYVTLELIAMHELLERNYEFPYIKLVERIQ